MTFTPTRRAAAAGAALAAASFGCAPRGEAQQAGTPQTPPAPLERREIPSSGEAIPIVGLGTWQAFDVTPGSGEDWTEARAALEAFVRGGGTVVDSSPMYGAAEAAVGALSADLAVNPKLFVATKVWTQGRAAGIAQMQASMAKLKRETLDLMQVHNLLDVETHLATLADWKAAGRVRHVGVTHYTEGSYEAVERVLAAHNLDFLQINYSAAERESEQRLLPLARERGVAVIANRPFAGGDVFRRLRSQPLPDWAAEFGAASWAQVLLKFVLSHPALTCAIPGTRNPRHVLDNLAAGSGPMPDAAMRERIAAAVAAS
jgi:diketogulonate reductase-like aldo/keto reductase